MIRIGNSPKEWHSSRKMFKCTHIELTPNAELCKREYQGTIINDARGGYFIESADGTFRHGYY